MTRIWKSSLPLQYSFCFLFAIGVFAFSLYRLWNAPADLWFVFMAIISFFSAIALFVPIVPNLDEEKVVNLLLNDRNYNQKIVATSATSLHNGNFRFRGVTIADVYYPQWSNKKYQVKDMKVSRFITLYFFDFPVAANSFCVVCDPRQLEKDQVQVFLYNPKL